MAKQKGEKKETKSEFLRRVLAGDPDLDHRRVNLKWARAGHAGEISSPLYYKVRGELGIRTVWVRGADPGPESPRGTSTTVATGEVHQFKVTLLDTNPPIWRRVQVSDCVLDTLHEHIQTAMGWTNSHMHHFRVDDTLYGDPRLLGETFEELKYLDSTRTMVSDLLPAGGGRTRLEYEYDFGDGWLHEVLFEGRLRAEPGKRYPLCLEGERACPPEDVGGVWGYTDFLKAVANPEHERYGEMRKWIGRKFDPAAFNPSKATARMRNGLPEW